MDLNSKEVSRLLECAAAMSAAQEKVTGNSKLDMAGIMAALAMAKTDGEAGESRIRTGGVGGGPQKSFLHTKFRAVEEKMEENNLRTNKFENKINKDTSKMETGQVVRAERVKVEEETLTSSWAGQRSESLKNDFRAAKSVFNDNNATVKSSLPPINIGNNNYENIQIESPKPALPPRRPIFASKNNINNSNDCDTLPVLNARSHSEMSTKSSADIMSKEMKVQEREGNDDSKKDQQVPALKSSLGVAKFIRQAKNSSSETVQKTKNQGETISQHATKPVSEAKRMLENNLKSTKEETKTPRELLQGSPGTISKFLKVVEKMSESKEKATGNGRLDMTELVSALSEFQNTNKVTPVFSESSPSVMAPALPTSAPPPAPPLPSAPRSPPGGGGRQKEVSPHARTSSPEQLGNLRNNDKSLFLKSTLSQTPSYPEGNCSNKTQTPSFMEEKSSLLGELKWRLNGEDNFQDIGTKNRQFPLTIPNQDQIVNKLVYNQYRGMLNSYRSNK